jgi:hypothetical protein
VQRIVELGESAVGAVGWRIEIRWDFHRQCLVGALVVVLALPPIEARLLLEPVGCRRFRGMLCEREMQALVPAVLLGMPGLDALQSDAEPQPPDRTACSARRARALTRRGHRYPCGSRGAGHGP